MAALQFDTIYHIYNRGNNREPLFYERQHYELFLEKYFHYSLPVLETFAYCLLPNHFHLLVRVRTEAEQYAILDPDITEKRLPLVPSRQLSHFFNSYAQSLNAELGRTGSLFQKNFKRKVVESSTYFRSLTLYIHRNPVKHGVCNDIKVYTHSSYRQIAGLNCKIYPLNPSFTLSEFGGLEAFKTSHNNLVTLPGSTDRWKG